MKVFTVDAPLESSEKKTAIASTQLAMMPAYKVVEKKKTGGSTLIKAVLFVIFAFLLAAVLTVVISEYAWKKRDGSHFFRILRWEDNHDQTPSELPFDAPSIPVQIDEPRPPMKSPETSQVVLQKPNQAEQLKQSPMVDLAKLDLLRTLVERIREHNQQQPNMMEGDSGTIAMISIEPFEGRRPWSNSHEHSSEEMDGRRQPATIDDPMDIPIQIHPPMTPSNRHGGGPQRPFGPWPSDDYYSASFYPDYQQYPDFPAESFGGHNGPRHNGGPPPPPFDAREFFNGPQRPDDQQYPDFSPEQFAAGPPPPFGRRGQHNGPQFNRPPMPDNNDFSDGPFGGRNGPPPFGPHQVDFPRDGPNGMNDGPFGGPPPPFGPFGGSDEPREEQSGSQQPTVRITQHFADKNSDRPSAIVTEIYGGKKLERMIGEIIANNAMPGMNAIEQPQQENMPPWMKRQFGPNSFNPSMIQGGSSSNSNPFFSGPNQMQTFNPFQAMNGMQGQQGGMMNQFNSAPNEINQQQFGMNLNQAQPMVQSAPFFHGANQMQQEPASQFRPDMPPFFAQNDQNDVMFPNHIFPNGNNQHQMGQQQGEIGNGVMFPQVMMPPSQHQMRPEQQEFNPFESAAGPQAHNQMQGQPMMDNMDPRMMQQMGGPQAANFNFNPEMQHWNEEMLQQNQHHFEGMTPEVFAASLNIAPDMAPQPPTQQEQFQKPQQTPPAGTVLGMNFNDQGMVFAPPKPPTQTNSDTADQAWLAPPNSATLHVDTPQERGPPAVAVEAPAAPPQSQDIPQPPIWNQPANQAQPQDAPVQSRSEGFGKAK